MTKIVVLPAGMKLVRTSKLHRNRRAEFDRINQHSVLRIQRDFDFIDRATARSALAELVRNPFTRLENERAVWTCEGVQSGAHLALDSESLVTVEPQIMNMLVNATGEALRSAFVQAFQGQPAAVMSRTVLEAMRSIIQYHPDEEIRTVYTFEINQLLEGIES